MNQYYITGTSSGIGKALAELALKSTDNHVTGISRRQGIEHENYKHDVIDLADLEKVQAYEFQDHSDADKIILVNNSGTLGQVRYAGGLDEKNLIEAFSLNLIAPAILMNKFIQRYRELNAVKLIINVGSGAANNPSDGWSVYCSSKAGLDIFSRVVELEQSIASLDQPFKVFSIAPGIVDTEMQEEIRTVDKSNFSRVQNFIDYKENGNLADPESIAKKFMRIIDQPEQFDEVVFSLRDIKE
ncbi:MAG: SDR family NAD(P)-dependent oxidoreductase [Bacteroidetes bacterium]|nr:SDR family NAD(P)-dependent oxidoreductase [Bacteroidota bacterium]